nr:MAG TPA: hypothetical protein [Bacteriophage sp.]
MSDSPLLMTQLIYIHIVTHIYTQCKSFTHNLNFQIILYTSSTHIYT